MRFKDKLDVLGILLLNVHQLFCQCIRKYEQYGIANTLKTL